MEKLVFATHNKHKIQEVKLLINNYQILSLDDIGFYKEIDETAETIEENALIKARLIHRFSHISCFADDTGLEVEALNGKPGVYSARYAGPEHDALKNIEKLLHELQGQTNRNARFRTVIALIMSRKEYLFEGIVNGTIGFECKGISGFGYDPVFYPQGYQQTFAEMPLDLKNQISHRALAIEKLLAFINERKNLK